MRITRIAGENIASLAAPFELDFTRPPLSEVDIFAITGPTGSGKSTLLDVVCLALYDTTPRYEASLRKSDRFVDSDGNEENATSTKLLMHRGAVSCYAETSFMVSSTHYTARWELRRARLRPTGRLQEVQMSLRNDTTGEIYQDTKNKVKERIVEIIGLSYQQFVRSVLLAQGDFSAFLRARDEEKGDILMRITGSEIYKQISQTIFQLAKEKREALELLRKELSLASLPSLEERTHTEQQLQQAKQTLAELQDAITEKRGQNELLKTYSSLCERFSMAERKWSELQPLLLKLPQLEEKLLRERAIQRLYSQKVQLLKLQKQRQEQLDEQERLLNRQRELDLALKETKQKLSETSEWLAKFLNKHRQEAPKREKASSLELEIAKLAGEIDQLRQKKSEKEREVNRLSERIERLSEQSKQQKEQLRKIETWYTHHQKQLAHIPSIPTLLPQLELLEKELELIQEAEAHLATEQEILIDLRKERSELEENLSHLEKALPEHIFLLRKELKKGEPCPVCGSTQHYYTTQKQTAIQLTEEEIQNTRRSLQEKLKLCLERLTKKESLQEELSTSIETRKRLFAERIETHSPHFLDLTDTPLSPETSFSLARTTLSHLYEDYLLHEEQKSKISLSLGESLKQLEELKKELSSKRADFEKESQHLANQEQSLKHFREEVKQLLGGLSLAEVEKRFAEKKDQLQTAEATLKSRESSLTATAKEVAEQLKKLAQETIPQLEKEFHNQEQLYQTALLQNQCSDDEVVAKSDEELNQLEQSIQNLRERKSSEATLLKERRIDKDLFLEGNPSFSPPCSNEQLQILIAQAEENLQKLQNEQDQEQRTIATLQIQLESYKELLAKETKLRETISKQEAEEANWTRLNTLFGSSDGKKLNILAQGVTLSRLILFANEQLKRFAPRYKLVRVPSSLALEVVDYDMLEQRRSVLSLSGGETFLISLALSLALSEISSYKLHIESLFIDEGFGTLDDETLAMALAALQQLNRSGRIVGIISHVERITSQLPVRIEVKKSGYGRSRLQIRTD